ncbi:phytoene/squalene synthase family protein [Halodurantibacterium flavum]|uniref:Phytoene/squalene synthase family protein n=1 Tax=Halodurantibacterium flavum TaxID=1382802 RepID=A0ABW4S5W0_9RHOB
MGDAALEEWARAQMAAGSSSFAMAARVMPRAARRDAMLLYGWCRHCDDMIDGQDMGGALREPPQAEQLLRLARLEDQTAAALAGADGLDPPFAALARVAARHDFPDAWPRDLLEGFRWDVERRPFVSIEDTLRYSYHVAGVVGVMMARIMGVRDPVVLDRACDLGLAFQLTNIARDVQEDARAGRAYLPADWLAEAGVRLDPEAPDPAVFPLVLRLLDMAEPYYASARVGIRALPPGCAWGIASAARIYRQIGVRLRQAGPAALSGRVSTGTGEKLRLVVSGLGDAAASRLPARETPREGLWTRPRSPGDQTS